MTRREDDTIRILGYGLASARACTLDGDRTAILTLAAAAEEALTTAEDHTIAAAGHKVVPDDAVLCLPARFIRSQLITLRQRRPDPTAPVSAREVKRLCERARSLLREQLSAQDEQNETWEPLALIGNLVLSVDGHSVSDAIGLKGRTLAVSVLGAAVPSRIMSSVAAIANKLEVSLHAVVATPQSLAALVPQRDAILIDVGHQGTSLSLVRHGALAATSWWPQGGEYFTTSLARTFRCIPERAEALKRAYVDNTLSQEDVLLVKRALEKPVGDWFNSLVSRLRTLVHEYWHGASGTLVYDRDTFAMERFEDLLPGRVFVTGGGSLLPDLVSTVRNVEMAVGIHFERAIEIETLGRSLRTRRPSHPLLLHVPHQPIGDLLASAIGLATSVVW
ncbi:MAG: hypothetical protein ACUVSF_01695 [Anaerolineae bacterium]